MRGSDKPGERSAMASRALASPTGISSQCGYHWARMEAACRSSRCAGESRTLATIEKNLGLARFASCRRRSRGRRRVRKPYAPAADAGSGRPRRSRRHRAVLRTRALILRRAFLPRRSALGGKAESIVRFVRRKLWFSGPCSPCVMSSRTAETCTASEGVVLMGLISDTRPPAGVRRLLHAEVRFRSKAQSTEKDDNLFPPESSEPAQTSGITHCMSIRNKSCNHFSTLSVTFRSGTHAASGPAPMLAESPAGLKPTGDNVDTPAAPPRHADEHGPAKAGGRHPRLSLVQTKAWMAGLRPP